MHTVISPMGNGRVLGFITMGGKALGQYDDYRKVEVTDGLFTGS